MMRRAGAGAPVAMGVVVAAAGVAAWLVGEGGVSAAQARRDAARAAAPAAQAWPTWRGPLAPARRRRPSRSLEWSETKNVRWKVAIPGLGKSSPIVWRDTVYVTTAIPGQSGTQKFTLVAINRADGKEKWSRILHEEVPHEGTHPDGSYAAGSALTDGERLYAWFGSRGLYAVDFSGKVLWEKQLGKMQTRNGFGEGSSVALHQGTLIVPWDHEGADFVVGPRRGDRPGEVAHAARGADDLGHAARLRRRRQAPGGALGHEPRRRLRLRDRCGDLAGGRHDRQRHPDAGLHRRRPDRDGRLPRQHGAGDPRRRGQGRRDRRAGAALDLREGHALRAVAARSTAVPSTS